jgi:hypothetical protein
MAKRAATLTERQQKWFKSVEDGIVRDTGKTLDQWAKIAKDAPEGTRARVRWLKDNYGIGVNRAAAILSRAFPDGLDWDDPDALLDHLWKDPAQRALYDRVAALVEKFEAVTVGPRKTFVGFSRKVQFAAVQPAKGGVRLGLALDPETSPRLEPRRKSESWSDRLKAVVAITSAKEIDAEVKRLLKLAYEGA